MWSPEKIAPLGPVYVAIADALARDIEDGRLEAGERLPTHRALARQLGVNVVTVTRAYQEASRRGLVEGEVGRGTFVRERERGALPYMPATETEPELVDFDFNVPFGDPAILDAASIFREFAENEELAHLATGYSPQGFEAHREAGAAWMARTGLETDPGRTLITCGAQHAMAITFSGLCEPGDLVLVEELTYAGMKALANVLHLRLAGLPMDDDGLLPDAFENACRKGTAKALYFQSTLQNPTGVVMPAERRHEIARIARRYGVVLVEDDTSGYLCAGAPAPAIAQAPELGYFLSSTSKSITAGLRIGYVQAPTREAVERLAANLAATAWMAPPLMAELATRWIQSGRADRMVEEKRAEALARRELYGRILADLPTRSHPSSSHVWVPLPSPWRGDDFVAQARRAGVAPTPAEMFVVGRASAPHAVRLALARPRERADVERGLRVLADVVRGAPKCRSLC